MRQSGATFLAGALAGVMVAACLVSSASGEGLEWRVRAGTDIVGERFNLIDTDTLDLSTDYRIQLETRWKTDSRRWQGVDLDSRIGIGTQALRHDFTGKATWLVGGPWQIEFSGLSIARYYLNTADGTRSNFAQGRADVLLERTLFGSSTLWGIDQGVEGTAYGTNSSVFLSGIRDWHGLAVKGRHDYDFYGGRAVFEHEHIPDSTGLDYVGLAGDCYGSASFGMNWDLSGDLTVSADHYRDPTVHPHQLLLNANTRVDWRFLLDWSAEFNPAFSLAAYDRSGSPASFDSIYYDYHRITPALYLVWWPTWGSVRAGPTADWQYSPTFDGEDYREWGGEVGFNLISRRWGFFDLTMKVGRRNYLNDAAAYFTDYTFWDSSLLVSANLPWGMRLDGFLILRDEYHTDSIDNTRSILLTFDFSHRL